MMAKDKNLVTVERHHLISAMAVAGVVETRNTIPILAQMVVTASGDGLSVAASDLDMWITAQIPANGAAWSTTIEARKLAALVGATDEGTQIGLSYDPEAKRVTMLAGRSRYVLPTLPVEDFPLVPADEDASVTISLPAKMLAAALSRVSFAQGRNVAYPFMCGVLVAVRGGDLIAAATDGNMLGEVRLGDAPADWPDAILPTKLVGELISVLKDYDGDVEISRSVEGHRLRFAWGEWTIVSKLIIGDFPNHRRIVPEQSERRVTVDADIFAKAVRRVAMVSAEKTTVLALSFSKNKMGLRFQSPGAGTSEEEITVDCDIDDLVIGFESKQLAGMIAATSGDTATLYPPTGASGMTRFDPAAGGGFVGVLSPIAL